MQPWTPWSSDCLSGGSAELWCFPAALCVVSEPHSRVNSQMPPGDSDQNGSPSSGCDLIPGQGAVRPGCVGNAMPLNGYLTSGVSAVTWSQWQRVWLKLVSYGWKRKSPVCFPVFCWEGLNFCRVRFICLILCGLWLCYHASVAFAKPSLYKSSSTFSSSVIVYSMIHFGIRDEVEIQPHPCPHGQVLVQHCWLSDQFSVKF